MILALNRDQLGAPDKWQLRAITPSSTIQFLSWDELSTKISPERRQVLYQERLYSSKLDFQPQEPKGIMFNSVLSHRCGFMIKLNPSNTARKESTDLFPPAPSRNGQCRYRCTGTKTKKGRKKQSTTEKIPFGGHLQLHCLNQRWNCAYRLPWWLWASYIISLRFHFPSEQWYFTTSQMRNEDSYRHDWKPTRHKSTARQISKLVKQRGSFTNT